MAETRRKKMLMANGKKYWCLYKQTDIARSRRFKVDIMSNRISWILWYVLIPYVLLSETFFCILILKNIHYLIINKTLSVLCPIN